MSHEVIDRLRNALSRARSGQGTGELDALLASLEEAWDQQDLVNRRCQQQLVRAARLAELGTMAGAVFHEMNQPLLGIKGFAELLLENLAESDEKTRGWIEEIHTQALRMHQMQQNVSGFLRSEPDGEQPVQLKPLLVQSVRLFTQRLRKHNIEVVTSLADDLPGLDIGRLHLTQILVNLIGNAVGAMQDTPGGTLMITAHRVPGEDRVRIVVTDTGQGIPGEIRKRIFEPFFTTRKKEGTGLGLYIARSLAESHGGTLRIVDPATLGREQKPSTAFELCLPVRDAPAPEAAGGTKGKERHVPAESTGSGRPGSTYTDRFLDQINRDLMEFGRSLQVTRRVLIVDDEPVVQRVLGEYLAQQNILADAVASAEEGIEKIEERPYAVLLADKNLPGMDGIQLLELARQRWPQMQVVVITGYASVESALDAIAAGAFDYIPKPFPSLSYVGDKVRGALARHDFDVRVRAMVDRLGQTAKEQLGTLDSKSQSGWVQRLKSVLADHQQESGPAHVLVVGQQGLASAAEKRGHRVSHVPDLDEAEPVIKGQDVRVVVYAEENPEIDTSEAIRRLHAHNRDLGVFVIAREGSLKQIVDAIGIGVGDYLVRPLEGRELFGPRLDRLVKRQQSVTRYRRLLEALKHLNIDLTVTSTASPDAGGG